jgi:hypothetical protein
VQQHLWLRFEKVPSGAGPVRGEIIQDDVDILFRSALHKHLPKNPTKSA